MKALFIKYKSVVKFILTFLLVYIILIGFYKFYLSHSIGTSTTSHYPDYITHNVAQQAEGLLQLLGYNTTASAYPERNSMVLMIDNSDYSVKIVEGCNSISVIILFIAFITAFSSNFKKTISYLLIGSILLYITNLIRIIIFTAGVHHYPQWSFIAHDIVFPLIIYGTLFSLWIIWVSYFSKIKNRSIG